jgi:predicted enzyme related to lactoylglutathione lyase
MFRTRGIMLAARVLAEPCRQVWCRREVVKLSLVEFPADDPERALRFWSGVLETELDDRSEAEGRGWQTRSADTTIGVHRRGTGPGDTVSLPYFSVADIEAALKRVVALGGAVIHPGTRWAICRDSEGSPFALAVDDALNDDGPHDGGPSEVTARSN